MHQKRKEDSAELRKKVFEMYKNGAPYNQISLKYKITGPRIQALLTYEPEYHQIKTLRITRKNKNQKRAVSQYDLDGKLIETYPSMRHAQQKTGVSHVSICKTAQHICPSAGGFLWEYAE
mgnify:CR=1 FL=1